LKDHSLKNIPININIPAIPEDQIKGVVVVKQGRARLIENYERRVDPRENIYYWLTGETQLSDQEDLDSDACCLKKGMITITPVYYDLTRHDVLTALRSLIKSEIF
jgi:5'-nucleotidase